jgi:hypothetical protein
MIKRFSNLLYYAYEDVMPCQHVGHVHSSSKEKLLPNIDVIYIVGGNSHSSPWLFLTKWLTKAWLAYLQETQIYTTYIKTYPPNGAHSLTLCGQHCIHYENVFTSCRRRPPNIPRSPRPRCAVMASRMTNTQPISHDMVSPQASLVLRGQVRDSHHLTGRNLSSYLFIGASLQNSKLHKVNTESKTQLTCHMLRLL